LGFQTENFSVRPKYPVQSQQSIAEFPGVPGAGAVPMLRPEAVRALPLKKVHALAWTFRADALARCCSSVEAIEKQQNQPLAPALF